MPTVIQADKFRNIMQERLPEDVLDRAVRLHAEYGPQNSKEITDLLMYASFNEPEMVKEIIRTLEAHFAEHLKEVPLEERGTRTNAVGGNETVAMFYRLRREKLKIEVTLA